MVDQIVDYKIDENWDLIFNKWNDLQVATGDLALKQKFVLIAQEFAGDFIGENPTATDLSRFSRTVIQEYRRSEYVNEAFLRDFEFEDGTMSFTIYVNGVTIEDTHTLF